MRVFRKIAFAVLALALASTVVACDGGQTEEANAATDRANAKIAEYNKRDAEIGGLMDEVSTLGDSDGDAQKGIDLSDQIIAKVAEQKAALEAAQAEYEKIAGLDVSEETKTYAKMQVDLAGKQLEANVLIEGLAGDMRELESQLLSGEATEASVEELSASLEERLTALAALEQEIGTLQQEADAYFEENLAG